MRKLAWIATVTFLSESLQAGVSIGADLSNPGIHARAGAYLDTGWILRLLPKVAGRVL